MFDTTIIKSGPSHVSVTENRAPTDSSVRLLKEFEEKATEKIIEAIQVSDNGFECVVLYSNDLLSMQKVFTVIYSIKGEKRVVEYRFNPTRGSLRDWVTGLVQEVAKDIAGKILDGPLQEALKQSKSFGNNP